MHYEYEDEDRLAPFLLTRAVVHLLLYLKDDSRDLSRVDGALTSFVDRSLKSVLFSSPLHNCILSLGTVIIFSSVHTSCGHSVSRLTLAHARSACSAPRRSSAAGQCSDARRFLKRHYRRAISLNLSTNYTTPAILSEAPSLCLHRRDSLEFSLRGAYSLRNI